MLNKIISQGSNGKYMAHTGYNNGGEFTKGAIFKDLQKKITRDNAELLPLLLIYGKGIKYGVI